MNKATAQVSPPQAPGPRHGPQCSPQDSGFRWKGDSKCSCDPSQKATAPEENQRRQHLWLDVPEEWQGGRDTEWVMFNHGWLCQAGRVGFRATQSNFLLRR